MTYLPARQSEIHRQTKETKIAIALTLDGTGRVDIKTGVPFMDHMLTLMAVHGFFDLTITAEGDIEVDGHHTVEDIGICLGQALKKALNANRGIKRFGNALVPMDETLVQVALDLSNRPFLAYQVTIRDSKVGTFDTELAKEFLRSLSLHGGITLHVDLVRGENTHHIIEAIFKALGRALDQATTVDSRLDGVLSSKGTL
ncbi:MAG: imidazoleglycerol-phosphate dehydratase HisB [Proteobacteria bacterium]|nr:imidazoleglycerol-phosphate dehydratase HisB [Desulfobulbaceae bacterium]MBU4153771.1 imidazoleglycerol-phosphate dehydratase HisB [Pseudomonadota bacterium]